MASNSVVVQLVPEARFRWGDGTVWELSQFHYPTTGTLIKFELQIDD